MHATRAALLFMWMGAMKLRLDRTLAQRSSSLSGGVFLWLKSSRKWHWLVILLVVSEHRVDDVAASAG